MKIGKFLALNSRFFFLSLLSLSINHHGPERRKGGTAADDEEDNDEKKRHMVGHRMNSVEKIDRTNNAAVVFEL